MNAVAMAAVLTFTAIAVIAFVMVLTSGLYAAGGWEAVAVFWGLVLLIFTISLCVIRHDECETRRDHDGTCRWNLEAR